MSRDTIPRDTTDYDSTEDLPSDNKKVVLYGDDAVARVREMEGGRELSVPEELVIREEGFVNAVYKDTKGISTYGVGQTGKYMDMPFGEVFKMHEDVARKYIKKYDEMGEEVKAAIMSAAYRGDLKQSPTFRRLFNAKKYKKAAKEFLNNDDYRESLVSGDGVAGRFERIAGAVLKLAG